MKLDNPFAITFGLKPDNYISRLSQTNEITTYFENSDKNNVYVISGVRGTGKTVMLSHIFEYFNAKKDWVCVEIIPSDDMREQLASKLYDYSLFHKFFSIKSFGFSFQGFSFSISGEKPVTNVLNLLEIIIKKIANTGKKILICIDEVAKTSYMVTFAQAFQVLLRQRLPIYLLMTGLYQNVYDLENEKTLTFLHRVQKIILQPLNIGAIESSYEELLKIDESFARSLAKETKGYAYAYQVLGYLVYENGCDKISKSLLNKYDQYLQEFVYEKIWSELSENDKKLLFAFEKETENVALLMERAGMEKNIFSKYRDRLIKKGIVSPVGYGKLEIVLPRFFEYTKTLE